MSRKKRDAYVKETVRDRLYTYGDYLNWSDEKRYELIDGQVYIMTPAPSPRHQKISVELLRQIAMYLFDKECEVFDAPFDVVLPEPDENSEDALTVVQPDILIICDKDKIDKRGCKGAPDFIIEIISPSSGGRDRRDKRDLYEKHGVKEYWLVD
ncbi:MAG: Uma2 family endonuclease, partial [Halanaerobiales bacterium]